MKDDDDDDDDVQDGRPRAEAAQHRPPWHKRWPGQTSGPEKNTVFTLGLMIAIRIIKQIESELHVAPWLFSSTFTHSWSRVMSWPVSDHNGLVLNAQTQKWDGMEISEFSVAKSTAFLCRANNVFQRSCYPRATETLTKLPSRQSFKCEQLLWLWSQSLLSYSGSPTSSWYSWSHFLLKASVVGSNIFLVQKYFRVTFISLQAAKSILLCQSQATLSYLLFGPAFNSADCVVSSSSGCLILHQKSFSYGQSHSL